MSLRQRDTPFQRRDEGMRLPDRAVDAMRGVAARTGAAVELASSGFDTDSTGFAPTMAPVWRRGVRTETTRARLCVVACR
jgi:hypothetical protein